MKKKYQINVLEQDLAVLSDSGDEHVANVVEYVEENVRRIQSAVGSKNILNIAILAALNIADEYIKLTGTNKKMCDELGERTEKLISLIENCQQPSSRP